MIRQQRRNTRTYTLLPSTKLFRSPLGATARLGRIGGDVLDAELGQRPADLGELALVYFAAGLGGVEVVRAPVRVEGAEQPRSEEHTSELQSLMRISYAVFCLKKKTSITITMITIVSNLLNKT